MIISLCIISAVVEVHLESSSDIMIEILILVKAIDITVHAQRISRVSQTSRFSSTFFDPVFVDFRLRTSCC